MSFLVFFIHLINLGDVIVSSNLVDICNSDTLFLAVGFLLINEFLLFDSLTILHKLIVELVVNESIHQRCPYDVVSLGDFVSHTPAR